MTMALDIPRLIVGDRVRDAAGNVGVTRSCRNRTTGTTFVGVWITHGPKAGQWGKGASFVPLLDHDGPPNLACRCRECERPFRAPDHRVACRTCAGLDRRRRPAAAAQDCAYTEEAAAASAGRTRHHSRASVAYETAPKPPAPRAPHLKHRKGCLCGETPDCTPF